MQKEKVPSLSANSNSYLLGNSKFQIKSQLDREKTNGYSTKLPPITTINSNQHHPIIFAKPKFPHSSLHTNQSLSNRLTITKKFDLELFEEDLNISAQNKKKNQAYGLNSSTTNPSNLKNLQHTGTSMHMPTNELQSQDSDPTQIKKTLGIETNDISNYSKIVKDLENIIEKSHFSTTTAKKSKTSFFDGNMSSKNIGDSRSKQFSPKKYQTPTLMNNKAPIIKMLSPLKFKPLNINFDHNIATSLLFSPNQLLTQEYLPKLEPSKSSTKKNGIVKAYSANTHQGLVRNYNEDRVAIILNIMKPQNKKDINWPLCSFFAIYDGHGGSKCAEFLRDNLHHYVVKDSNFPTSPKLAIRKGFQLAEKNFLEHAQNKNGGVLERSGSCAIVVLIVDDMCYVANVGDSRAVLSQEKGNKIFPLSKDHKPEEEDEKNRILEAGGQVYQSQSQTMQVQNNSGSVSKTIQGPFRVLPGRLSVSRTFGDAEAKLKGYGGNPNVIIAEPDIKSFKINETHDFIVLGCDGIFDRLNNKDVMKALWETTSFNKYKDIHEFSARAVENLMKDALIHKTLDNITIVMISFKNLKKALFVKKSNKNEIENQADIDKNGNLIIDKLELIEYNYSPDNPNEGSMEDSPNEKNILKGKEKEQVKILAKK